MSLAHDAEIVKRTDVTHDAFLGGRLTITQPAKGVRAGFLTRVPKGRLGEPEDLAGPILFLASKASDFYTGHILYADGGYTAG